MPKVPVPHAPAISAIKNAKEIQMVMISRLLGVSLKAAMMPVDATALKSLGRPVGCLYPGRGEVVVSWLIHLGWKVD